MLMEGPQELFIFLEFNILFLLYFLSPPPLPFVGPVFFLIFDNEILVVENSDLFPIIPGTFGSEEYAAVVVLDEIVNIPTHSKKREGRRGERERKGKKEEGSVALYSAIHAPCK